MYIKVMHIGNLGIPILRATMIEEIHGRNCGRALLGHVERELQNTKLQASTFMIIDYNMSDK